MYESYGNQFVTNGGTNVFAAYTFDTLNRLKSVTDSSNGVPNYSRAFAYDEFGNMTVIGNTGVPLSSLAPQAGDINPANNRMIPGTYNDARGNLTALGAVSMSYDGESRQTQTVDTGSGQTISYLYDALGQRVEKLVSGGATTVFVHDAFGQLAAEYNSVGVAPACQTCYLAYDSLGSLRLVTDSAANVIARHDYQPFGEEIPNGYANRLGNGFGNGANITQMFTGQERDGGTATLDYFNARHLSAVTGSFTQPDPMNIGADLTHPQSWNGYGYVGGNPLGYTDPSGMNWFTDLFSKVGSFLGNVFGTCGSDFCGGTVGTNGTEEYVNSAGLSSGGTGSGGDPVYTATGLGKGDLPTIGLSLSTSLVFPAKNGTRNCSASSASAGQYAIASAAIAGMTAEFFSGIGAQDRTFGADSSVSQVMAQSGPVQDVLNDYTMTGRTSNLYTFGATGYVAAGANPVAQFVGSFRYSISPANGGINLRLTNTTSFKSLTYDKGPQWKRRTTYPGAGIPMGNTHQVYNIFVPCG